MICINFFCLSYIVLVKYMKKIFIVVSFILFFSTSIKVNASVETAKSYVLMDMDSNRVLLSKNKDKYEGEVIELGNTLEEVASNLFNVLIEMDNRKIDIIYTEAFPNDGVGRAIMNRLMKSAGYKFIKV